MQETDEEEKAKSATEEARYIGRIESFSDGVFAVAITLLVLNLVIPNIPEKLVDQKLPHELIKLWPRFEGFALSFLIIGMFWIAHHFFFRFIKRHNSNFLWINLAFLMCIAFLPFTTNLMSLYGDSRVAIIFYAASMAVTAIVLCLLWAYAAKGNRLVDRNFDTEMAKHLIYVYMNIALIFLISIGISYASTDAAKYFWILIFPNSLLLERMRHRKKKSVD